MKRQQRRKQPAKREIKRKKAPPKQSASQAKTIPHHLYGDIPLVEKKITGLDGIERSYYDFDLSYQPVLPRGAVRGDPVRQVFCTACHAPKYFYLDERRHCIQCGKDFLFSAKEQKYWYEHLKFNFYSEAVRCLTCRRRKRSEQAIRNQLMRASGRADEEAANPLALLAYCEAAAAHYEAFGSGNLNRAIGLARRAAKLAPHLHASKFWEAECQLLSGRRGNAAGLYADFIRSAAGEKGSSALMQRARRRLAEFSQDR